MLKGECSIDYTILVKTVKAFADGSNNISIQEIGESSHGKKLFCVMISENKKNQCLNSLLGCKPPRDTAKIPVVITAAVHGHERCGTAAVLRLLEYFSEKKEWLKHLHLILIPCVNPDGFEHNTRFNGKGFDLNRDFITQSQSETKAIVRLIAEYNPVVLLDLHGFVCKDPHKIGVIEPSTPPHNPVYEYDLYLQNAMPMAEYIEKYLLDNKDTFVSKRYKEMTGTYIPLRDSTSGWDDYTPFSIAMYSLLHGTVGCTIEAPTRAADSISWLYLAVLGACRYIITNKQHLLKNHIEFINRGKEGRHPLHPNGFFPEAYLLRKKNAEIAPLVKLINHLQWNGVHIDKRTNDEYYIDLHQPKAILAHTFLWSGEDLSPKPFKMTELCAWSLPLLWGVESIPLYRRETAETTKGQDVPFIPQNLAKVQRDSYATPFHLSPKKIALIEDGGLYGKKSHAGAREALTMMGYSVTELPPQQLAAQRSLNNFTVLIYNSYEQLFYTAEKMPQRYKKYVFASISERENGTKNIIEFIEAGGMFITIGAGGARVARIFLKLTKATVNVSGWNNNGIVNIRYIPGPLTEGYLATDIGFVYRPVWFTNTTEAVVVANYDSGPGSFIAGYWPEHSKAEGEAAILTEKDGRVVLIGPEICHRAHTEYLYRLIANTIEHNN
ncbi:murein peptide amidase A [Sporotomaculum syntrophicum]|uniref:Murein peptide amidase A n=1 Tax=Sporotomaculum syntrophicum TaxID=182264 RepID=A0A9D2WMC3_9FIRM|nr:DUF2817 domain-containing protein [Sporotomaculum syntrophicum]KAF1083824.1 murein peptide amidase A [Sporotomaculum syntrophicum]